MPLISTNSFASWLKSSLSAEMDILPDGAIELARSNKWPNQYMQEFSEDGEPTGVDLRWNVEKKVGSHVHITASAGSGRSFGRPPPP